MGDLNINLLNHNSHNATSIFLNVYQKLLHILLDHIYSNSNPDLKECGIIYSSLSDHLPVYWLTKFPQDKDIPESQPILIRNTSFENKAKFREKLQVNDWTSIMINEDPVTAFSEFSSTLNNIFEDSFPLIE